METKINQKKKIKPTLTKGVAKVPVVMQLEALECGAASLTMLMAYYGKWVPLEEVRLACGVSRDGSNAKNIYLAAQHYGFEVKAMRMTPESLQKKGQFPCILHWNMNHFVVLDGFRGKYACLNDPARGMVKVTMEELTAHDMESEHSGPVGSAVLYADRSDRHGAERPLYQPKTPLGHGNHPFPQHRADRSKSAGE